MDFAQRLKYLRNINKITQEQLSTYLGVGRPTIAGYETKGTQPSFEILYKIADFFDVSVDYLLGRTEIKKPSQYFIKKNDLFLISDDVLSYNKKHKDIISINSFFMLSKKNQKKAIEYIKMLKLLEDNDLDIEE